MLSLDLPTYSDTRRRMSSSWGYFLQTMKPLIVFIQLGYPHHLSPCLLSRLQWIQDFNSLSLIATIYSRICMSYDKIVFLLKGILYFFHSYFTTLDYIFQYSGTSKQAKRYNYLYKRISIFNFRDISRIVWESSNNNSKFSSEIHIFHLFLFKLL